MVIHTVSTSVGNECYFKALKFLLIHLCILVKCHESTHERGMCAFNVVLPAHLVPHSPPVLSPVPAAQAYICSFPTPINIILSELQMRVLVAISPIIFNQTEVKLSTFVVL